MKITSIKFKLIAGGITLVLLPLVVVSYLSTSASFTALTDLAKDQVKNIAEDLAGLADNALTQEINQVDGISTDPRIINVLSLVKQGGINGATEKTNELNQGLSKTFAKMGANHYQGIYITDPEGARVAGVLEDGSEYTGKSIADRDFFKNVKATGKTVIDNISRSVATNKLICNICSPVKSENQSIIGTVVIVVKVDYINQLISGRKIGKTGYGFMTDQNGLMIAHPVPENILKLGMTKLSGMEKLTKRMFSEASGFNKEMAC